MRLISINYKEHSGQPQEWILNGLELNAKNLLVGKNASGKSRTLNVINALARYLTGQQAVGVSSDYDCIFDHNNQRYQYILHIKNQEVISEKILIDEKVFLDRGAGGAGTIFAEKIEEGMNIDFQVPTSVLAAVARRDAIQHSFIEPLYTWASMLRYYPFNTTLGKEGFIILDQNAPKVDDRDFNAVVGIFREGVKQFNEAFTTALKNDLEAVDYHVEEVNIGVPVSVLFHGSIEPLGLYVKEKDLPGITDQFSMSTGMFRVLSLLIQTNYLQLNRTATTVIVDDIGEGLDFDRSCKLINLLRNKADNSQLQIILSTNDKFIMNNVPLSEWSILQRSGNIVEVKNYRNSKERFDEFRFTGLSNFSFLEYDYLNDQSENE
jgi:hypothetical protein